MDWGDRRLTAQCCGSADRVDTAPPGGTAPGHWNGAHHLRSCRMAGPSLGGGHRRRSRSSPDPTGRGQGPGEEKLTETGGKAAGRGACSGVFETAALGQPRRPYRDRFY